MRTSQAVRRSRCQPGDVSPSTWDYPPQGVFPGVPGWPDSRRVHATGSSQEVSLRSTMMDIPLTVTRIMQYGTSVYGDREVVTYSPAGLRRQPYSETGVRAARLAHALRSLGVDADQRDATLMWNNAEHLEASLAIPSI